MCSIEEKYQDTDQGIEQSVTVKFDFTWYPFDTQKFIIPMPAGENKLCSFSFLEENLSLILKTYIGN